MRKKAEDSVKKQKTKRKARTAAKVARGTKTQKEIDRKVVYLDLKGEVKKVIKNKKK